MRIVGIAMVKNEADIIEAFVRHNLQFLDSLWIINHDSFDGTENILAKLQAEGLPLTVLLETELGFLQAEKTTGLCRKAFKETSADFIFVLDADEFIRVDTRPKLETILAGLPPGMPALIPTQTYVPTTSDIAQSASPPIRITRRLASEAMVVHKVIIPSSVMENPENIIIPGNHSIFSPEKPLNHAKLTREVALAHYPVRSADQLITKILIGWLAYIVMDRHQFTLANHWRVLYRQFMARPHLTGEELQNIAMSYYSDNPGNVPSAAKLQEDPLEISVECKYSALAITAPLILIMRMAEKLAARDNSSRGVKDTPYFVMVNQLLTPMNPE